MYIRKNMAKLDSIIVQRGHKSLEYSQVTSFGHGQDVSVLLTDSENI